MSKQKTMALLHEALSAAQSDADELVERLARIYRDEENPESMERVVALGFLACAHALRETSLIEEIAVREELQELGRLIDEVLAELRRTELAVRRRQPVSRRATTRSLEADLRPPRKADPPEPT
jgi:hypothetical protein